MFLSVRLDSSCIGEHKFKSHVAEPKSQMYHQYSAAYPKLKIRKHSLSSEQESWNLESQNIFSLSLKVIEDSLSFAQALQTLLEQFFDLQLESFSDNFFKPQHVLTNLLQSNVREDFLSTADQASRANKSSYSAVRASEILSVASSFQLCHAMQSTDFYDLSSRQPHVALFLAKLEDTIRWTFR